jgi:hypothetical protein
MLILNRNEPPSLKKKKKNHQAFAIDIDLNTEN